MILMTNQHVLLVKNGKRKQKVILSNIKFISVYKNKQRYQMRVAGLQHLVIKTKEENNLKDLYNTIILMPTRILQNTKYEVKLGPDPGSKLFCQRCFPC